MQKKLVAFTLVELIVVITILAILGTIGFVSLQGYSVNARDSVRISDTKTFLKALNIYQTKNGEVPLPDDMTTITGSGVVFSYQGTLSGSVITQLGQGQVPVDPLLGTPYLYATNDTQAKFQILSYMEKNASVVQGITSFAKVADSYSEYFPKVQGDTVGLIIHADKSPVVAESELDLFNNSQDLTLIMSSESQVTSSGNLATYMNLLRGESRQLDPNVLIYYNFDENTNDLIQDLSLYEHHGNYGGSIEFIDGYARDVTNPRSAYIESKVPINFGQKDYTLSAWVYYDSSRPSGHFCIFSAGLGSQEILLLNNNASFFNYMTSGNWVWGSSPSSFPRDTWVHYVITTDTSGNTQVFINGVGGDEVDIGDFPDKRINLNVMSYGKSASYSVDRIDEVRVFDRKLSEDEIQKLYETTIHYISY